MRFKRKHASDNKNGISWEKRSGMKIEYTNTDEEKNFGSNDC